MKKVRIIVVGGGLAGLMATIKIAEMEQEVDLFSIVPVRRSHSVCAQGGPPLRRRETPAHGLRGRHDRTTVALRAGRTGTAARSGGIGEEA
jgi:succinate dehydrogenase/fumarate reductase flavoprotein subunit